MVRKGQTCSEVDVRRGAAASRPSAATSSRLRVRRGSSLTDLDKLVVRSGGSSGGGSIGDLMNMLSGSNSSVMSDTLVARTVPLETVRRTPMSPLRAPPSPLVQRPRPPVSPVPMGPLTMAQRTLRFSRLLKYQPSSTDTPLPITIRWARQQTLGINCEQGHARTSRPHASPTSDRSPMRLGSE
ncbi:hypothetical protein EVAR_38012_1 [Eumeta japonica]|uniref:Uncharacterized protein n=1 Tax=Eumeta variegata TaxID=151549 RepID=A0A4C1WWV9_EUMVA|nr:hypothetical protein EVAR_38012_1 [Eumeta japonica]